MRRTNHLAPFCIGVFLSSGIAINTAALELNLSVSQTSEYTTNSELTETDEIEEWVHSPGARLTASHDGPSLSMAVDYNAVDNNYQQSEFDYDREVVGIANITWNALPERLDLIVDHTRTQSPIRASTTATPNNLQESLYTTVGPRLHFNPRGEDEILVEYLYGARSTTETSTDATTHDSSIKYVLAVSPTNYLTFALIKNQVQWDNPDDPDIDYNLKQITWDREGSNLNFSLTAGHNRAERTEGLANVSQFVFDVGVEWQVRPGILMTFLAAQDIRDRTYSLNTGEFASQLDFGASSASAEVFVSTRYGVGINYQFGQRTIIDFSVVSNDEDYEEGVADDDNNALHYILRLDRQISERLNLGLRFVYDPLEYPDLEQDDIILSSTLSLDYNFSRRLNFGFGLRYGGRKSKLPSGTEEYNEWAASASISYDLIRVSR